ncbi:MAG: MOSC domain-containing protein [Vulcanimicrobiota bacterium]
MMGAEGSVISINVSEKKSVRKKACETARLRQEFGIEGDAHAGAGHRQVSLLAEESIEKMKAVGLNVGPGDFAENITTKGLDLLSLPCGTKIVLGQDVVLEITQHGKECNKPCAIYYQAGDCVMPREGIFARVLHGGEITRGDSIREIAE